MTAAASPRKRPQRQGIADKPSNGTALLVIDMISCWSFPDGDALARRAVRIASVIAALRDRCRAQDVPVIYANDNSGQWRSDFKFVVRESLESPGDGARITRLLEPGDDDYFILKPKHSAFFATPLELLLDHLAARRLIFTGVTSDQCIATTVADARMRDFDVVVPEDCVATITPARNRLALASLRDVQNVLTTPSQRLRLERG